MNKKTNDFTSHRDFLNQYNFIRIFGRYFNIGKFLHSKLRKLFPEKCSLCGGLLHQRLIEGNLEQCHGSITRNGKDYYICYLCYETLKKNGKL
jgi:hypothetical protein